jgi:two-component system sensor histidine kinase AlgZ
MPNSQIIRQIHPHDALPDFRSQGVLLRTLVFCNAAGLLVAMMRSSGWGSLVGEFMVAAAALQPVLLGSLLLLYALNPVLSALPYRKGVAAVLALVAFVLLAAVRIGGEVYLERFEPVGFVLTRDVVAALAGSAALLFYFRLRAIGLAPSLYNARVQALQARIRPHFLFNCINTVLSLVRSDPKGAETALEDMSDLFRMAMAHDESLVPLREEIELSRRYLALEQLRLGERLRFNWRQTDIPEDALVPPLILQPLLENAVYHGIEPLSDGGVIDVALERRGSDIQMTVRNPSAKTKYRRAGNKLALTNIRERLDLLFDIEAQYKVEDGPDFYDVRIVMPYVKEGQL